MKLGKEVPIGLETFQNVQKLTFEGVNPWELAPVLRGQLIDKLLGNNLGATFKTYDKLEGTVATSFKSIDVGCKTYQTTSGFMSLLKKHATDLMNGANSIDVGENIVEITQKVLCLVFPEKILTDKQLKVIEEFIGKYGTELKIEFVIIP